MNRFFEVKVRYEKIDASGKEKMVTEPYLIDGVSFGDTEASIHKEMEPYITGEFEVVSEKIANFAEIVENPSGDRWFKCKVVFVSIDEEKGVEKKSATWMLVQALNVNQAYRWLQNHLKDTVSDFEIPSVAESPIMDVFVKNVKA